MSLTAEDIPVVEIPRPQDDPEVGEEAARFILKNLYRQHNPNAGRLTAQMEDLNRRTTVAAFDGDVMVATGSLEIGLPGEARLDDMAVRDDYRRIGIGSKIVRMIETMAAAEGAEEIRFVSAVTAVAFYRKLGYTAEEATMFCSKALAEAGEDSIAA